MQEQYDCNPNTRKAALVKSLAGTKAATIGVIQVTLGLLLLCSSASIVLAQNNSESADNSTSVDESFSQDADEDSTGMELGRLLQRISDLEDELSRSYGRIEQLEHQVQQLRHEARERYVDIDNRIRQLAGESTAVADAVTTASPDTEAGMYKIAFALLEDGDYKDSIAGFEAMIEKYPNGKLLPDAFYWLGELYTQLDPPQWEQSRQSLVQLLRLFPDHAKVPEGTFKLGTTYHNLGDPSKALEYLDRVVNDFPNSSAARLAEEYASQIRE